MCKSKFPKIVGVMLVSALFSHASLADTVIIGNKSMKDGLIDAAIAKKLWLGKVKKLPGIGKVTILDQEKHSAIRDDFYKKVTNKNSLQIKAYWAKIIFTGKSLPPKSLSSSGEVLERVRDSDHVIGYVDRAAIDDTVKVLYTVK